VNWNTLGKVLTAHILGEVGEKSIFLYKSHVQKNAIL